MKLYLVGEIEVYDEKPTTRFLDEKVGDTFKIYIPCNLFNYQKQLTSLEIVLSDIVREHKTNFIGKIYFRFMLIEDLTDEIL